MDDEYERLVAYAQESTDKVGDLNADPSDAAFDDLLAEASAYSSTQVNDPHDSGVTEHTTSAVNSSQRTKAILTMSLLDDSLLNASGSNESQKKQKKKIEYAKLNAEKLLTNEGLPALRKSAKKLTLFGKGHEVKDLEKVMRLYQLWGAELFPKLAFRDFLEKTERVCREKRPRVYLGQVLNDEYRRKKGGSYDIVVKDDFGESIQKPIVKKEPMSDERDQDSNDTRSTLEPKSQPARPIYSDSEEENQLPVMKGTIFTKRIESDDEDYFALAQPS